MRIYMSCYPIYFLYQLEYYSPMFSKLTVNLIEFNKHEVFSGPISAARQEFD